MMYEQLLTWAYGGVGCIVLLGYLPQIWKLATADSPSNAVSLHTWFIWTATGFISLLYAVSVMKDPVMIFNMAANFLGCISITGLTVYNQYLRFREPPLHVEIAEKLNASAAGTMDSKMYSAGQ